MIKISRDRFSKTNGGHFEGWGTSLCWWAHRVGYSQTLCDKAAKLFFSKDGLGLNIMRYNIGGGDDPEHKHIERSDSAVPGWLSYDKLTREKIWDYEADKNQLSLLKSAYKAAGEDAYVEVFSNSPPYFMTESGCSSGSHNGVTDNLKKECITEFAEYLSDVAKYIEEFLNIRIKSIAPMNEPDTDYWKELSPKQEGCHISPGKMQSELICSVRNAFDSKGLKHILLAASDETSTERQINSYNMYSPEAKKAIGRISTHSYITDKIEELGQLREKEGFNLWMSEVDGAGVAGEEAGEMSSALWLAKKIISDINALSPSAWVLWLVMDYHKSKNGYGGNPDNCNYDKNAGFWGLGHCDHDAQEYILTMKYYGFGQFTRYIKKGMTLIHIDENSLGAYDKQNEKLVIVTVNDTKAQKEISFDISDLEFDDADVESYATYIKGNEHKKWSADKFGEIVEATLYATLQPNSITTFIVGSKNIDF